ncbi:hypothetical protein PRIPAC_82585 [Pristionchus pacificus]|uniref:STAC3-related SH3 domain-containing protein n=1 Tax=Pristionchus pacificus TaxID=54126 RepID=A0A2A6C412_PRIPA|nr:hypothetical protein PRIPAC_82585 [Pristionchus pacificus]|eukprot:PDM72856.1 hypothetical protein PRIPAC_39290 [Pristionchus pacificus]
MSSSTRRLSLPQTPTGLPLHGQLSHSSSRLPSSIPHPHNRSLSSIFTASIPPHPIQTSYRHSQPEIRFADPIVSSTHRYNPHSTPPRTPRTCQLPRRYLKRAPQSDLAYRLQRHHNDLSERGNSSNESTPSRDVDPVYLALKQATARYPAPTGGSRRSSSSHLVDSQTPSPRNLSQVSLQDSGYSDVMGYKHGETHSQPRMLGSTPQLDDRDPTPPSSSRRRAPKLSKQMKSLSLDCDAPPRVVNGHTRSPARGRLLPRTQAIGRGPNGSGSDLSDWERSCSPGGVHVYGTAPSSAPIHSRRASSSAVSTPRPYVVTHEYIPADGSALLLGDRMQIVENGDPDWLHGFKLDDRTEKLYSFPATCVALMRNGEQPMKIVQNVFVADQKLRLYRDQVVFAQPETMRDGKVTVRTERDAYVPVALQHLSLL